MWTALIAVRTANNSTRAASTAGSPNPPGRTNCEERAALLCANARRGKPPADPLTNAPGASQDRRCTRILFLQFKRPISVNCRCQSWNNSWGVSPNSIYVMQSSLLRGRKDRIAHHHHSSAVQTARLSPLAASQLVNCTPPHTPRWNPSCRASRRPHLYHAAVVLFKKSVYCCESRPQTWHTHDGSHTKAICSRLCKNPLLTFHREVIISVSTTQGKVWQVIFLLAKQRGRLRGIYALCQGSS